MDHLFSETKRDKMRIDGWVSLLCHYSKYLYIRTTTDDTANHSFDSVDYCMRLQMKKAVGEHRYSESLALSCGWHDDECVELDM